MPRARSVSAARTTAARAAREFFDAGDERKHDAERAVCRGAQQRTQLCLKHIVHRQAEPNAAQTERRSRAVGVRMLERQLRSLTSNVRIVTRPGDMLSTSRVYAGELRFFRQRRVSAPRQQEFRSEQADAFGAGFSRPHRIVGRFDVGLEPDLDAVLGDRRQPAVFVERLFELFAPLLPCPDVLQRRRIRIDEHFAARAIDRNQGAGRDQLLALRSPATAGT